MKLQKRTKNDEATERRRYDDACGTAHALDLIGDRWALLVVRELMFGGRRFGEVRASLPGISANVLTQRLEALEAAGIAQRRKLPPPASVHVYELTPWGYEAEEAIKVLGRWAARSPRHDPRLPLSAASLMLSFRTMFSAARAGDLCAAVAFRIGEEAFMASIAGGVITISRGSDERAGLTIAAATAPMIAAIVYGGVPIDVAVAQGIVTMAGDRQLAERFITLFPLPPKVGSA